MGRAVRTVTLVNAHGLHARPTSKILEVARRHQANLEIRCGAVVADGRRMLSLLTLAAPPGATLELTADGDDAEQLLDALEELVRSRFGEPPP